MARDPLGRRPRHKTGRREPDYTDPDTRIREAAAIKAARTIWIDHPPQANVVGRILAYRLATLGGGSDLDGLCLSQASHAGKTSTMKQVKRELEQERVARGEEPNEYQVIIVGLDQKTSLKSVLQDILIRMDDEDWDLGTEKQLRQRIRKFVARLGVELIIIDECQHLYRAENARKAHSDVADVTDAIKRILDLGIAPLVLVGTFEAEQVFNKNQQLRARLGLPLRLPALNMKRTGQAIHFRNFVADYDAALVASLAVKASAGLVDPDILEALKKVSGGYVGRVARVLKNAAAHAAARGAVTIERYDLSYVTRAYAIPAKWVDFDPFSTGAN